MSRSAALEVSWNSPRWDGITRAYQAKDVERLRGTAGVEHSFARTGAEKLWRLLHQEEYTLVLGALTGNQAVEMSKSGLKAVYLSSRRDRDGILGAQTSPDQSHYPVNSVPDTVRSINNALMRTDQITHAEGQNSVDRMVPIIVDSETALGGALNAFELTKNMIEAGAAAVHFSDHLSSAKKSGNMGGTVLVPTREAIHKLIAARLAADILDVPTLLIARTHANGAHLITSDSDPDDKPFLTGERTIEGFFAMRGGVEVAIARGIAYAPYADILWCETPTPNLAEARKFAKAIHAEFPGKLLAYNCSPSSHWKSELNDWEISQFQRDLAAMGYRFQLVAPAGFDASNPSALEFAHPYAHAGNAGLFATATA